MIPRYIDKTAKVLAGVGALNLGLTEFMRVNLISLLPSALSLVTIGAISVSGGYLLYLIFRKSI